MLHLLAETLPEGLTCTLLERSLSGTANQPLCHQAPENRLLDSHDTLKESTTPDGTCTVPSDLRVEVFWSWSRDDIWQDSLPRIFRVHLLKVCLPNLWWGHDASGDLQCLWSLKHVLKRKSAWEFSLWPLLLTLKWLQYTSTLCFHSNMGCYAQSFLIWGWGGRGESRWAGVGKKLLKLKKSNSWSVMLLEKYFSQKGEG